MRANDIGHAVDRRLEGAQHLAGAAVRTFLTSMPELRSRGIERILDDVDRLFAQVEEAERLATLARSAASPTRALDYAEHAYALAFAALDDASRCVRGLRGGSHEL